MLHSLISHDDVIKWKHFPRNWPFVRGIHRSPVNSPHKGQWRRALTFNCAWMNGWVNSGKPGDLRRHHVHYDVIVMSWHHRGSLQVRYNERHGVLNRQHLDCLLSRLIRRTTNQITKLSFTGFVWRGIHRWPVDSPNKGPVTRKMFPFDDVIGLWLMQSWGTCISIAQIIIFTINQFICWTNVRQCDSKCNCLVTDGVAGIYVNF